MINSDSQSNAINFFNEKGREFEKEFTALFLSKGKTIPPTGDNIAKMIGLYGKEFAIGVHKIINSDSNFLGLGTGMYKEIANKAFGKYKEASTPIDKPEEKKIMGLSKPLAVGIALVLLLIIVIVIMKKASK